MTDENEKQEIAVQTHEDALKTLDDKTESLLAEIAKSEDTDKLKELLELFNIHSIKKNVFRVAELEKLLSMVDKQAIKRFEQKPNEFSNKDVLDYMTATQNAINNAMTRVKGINEEPIIQINNQTNINVNKPQFDRESRERILETVQEILQQAKAEKVVDVEFDETIEKENKDDK